MRRKDLLKLILHCRQGLYLNHKILDEEGDDRYSKSFIDGMMIGLRQAIGVIDATLELYEREDSPNINNVCNICDAYNYLNYSKLEEKEDENKQ